MSTSPLHPHIPLDSKIEAFGSDGCTRKQTQPQHIDAEVRWYDTICVPLARSVQGSLVGAVPWLRCGLLEGVIVKAKALGAPQVQHLPTLEEASAPAAEEASLEAELAAAAADTSMEPLRLSVEQAAALAAAADALGDSAGATTSNGGEQIDDASFAIPKVEALAGRPSDPRVSAVHAQVDGVVKLEPISSEPNHAEDHGAGVDQRTYTAGLGVPVKAEPESPVETGGEGNGNVAVGVGTGLAGAEVSSAEEAGGVSKVEGEERNMTEGGEGPNADMGLLHGGDSGQRGLKRGLGDEAGLAIADSFDRSVKVKAEP